MKETTKARLKILIVGLIIGAIAVILVQFGNPKNMGFCIACFIRDMAGATGMHRAAAVQYIRPEVIGLCFGAFAMAIFKKEFVSRGGSAPVTRFVLGAFVMIGALVFLGCPLRMVLRLAGGDMTALLGLAGFAAGIFGGVLFLKNGYSLKRTYPQPKLEGALMPIIQIGFLILLIAAPAFILFSEAGPGSMHAPVWMALAAGIIAGGLAQRTRLCMVGGIRDVILFKDTTLLIGFIGIFVAALVGNLITGDFNFGFTNQPVAHNDMLWNFLSMASVGLGSVMLGGCPMRQIILASEGNSDSTITLFGLFAGAAVAHNFGLASAPAVLKDGVLTGGPTPAGKVAVVIGIIVMIVIAFANSKKAKENAK